jgi:hypothetical protein
MNPDTAGVPGVWLVIMPASGTVLRVEGAIFASDPGAGLTPMALLPSGKFMAFDPRALIVEDRTLIPVWRPRDHLARVHPAAREWLAQNPDVFNPPVVKE